MRIITWNCNMAFRRKAEHILAHKPDILVVPECEHPDKLKFPAGVPLPNDAFWYGKNLHKGLAVFSYGDLRFEVLDAHDPLFRTIIPLRVKNSRTTFTLFAVWANNPDEPRHQYVGQTWKAVNAYGDLLTGGSTLLVGDLNSNTIWDKPKRIGNHSDLVAFLHAKNIYSTYHAHVGEAHGKERQNTLFLHRHPDKGYHIDYCFASADLMARLRTVDVRPFAEWKTHSDHVPLIVDFDV